MSAPRSLDRLLADTLLGRHRHAWATLDTAQRIIGSGGELAAALGGLPAGEQIQTALPCLHGMLPMTGDNLSVPRVSLGNDLTVDIHLRREPSGWLIVLLDVSAEQHRERQLLQRGHGAASPAAAATHSEATLTGLLHALDMCAIECHGDGQLAPIGTIPQWARSFAEALQDSQRELFADPAFAFLGSFIFDARELWRTGRPGALRSGPWVDMDAAGTEYVYEATAVNAPVRHLLLIERNSRTADLQRDLVGTGRRQALSSRENARDLARTSTALADLERERGNLIEHAQAAQHIEALGSLTGGIAHDFNNVLTAIIGFAELGASEAPAGTRQHDHFRFVLQAGERARSLIREILTLSSRRQSRAELVSLRDIVTEVLGLVRATIPHHIDVGADLTSPAHVRANPTQLHQVVLNLCTNAIHAIGGAPGRLTITLDEVEVPPADDPDPKPAGVHARLRVSDTGGGIDPDVRARIFDPFFTTKPAGQGTGIGLSVVHGIVTRGRARIRVDSEPGSGSTFEILWPLAGATQAARETESDDAVTGSERILFVDDDPLQVELARRMLGTLGYDVLALTDAREALAQLRRRRGTWDMLITDQAMPGATGASLAREVLRTQPGFPVLVCSGNVSPELVDNLLAMGVADVLLKPVRWRQMAEVIRRCLHPQHHHGASA